jgi:hypothetical protein
MVSAISTRLVLVLAGGAELHRWMTLLFCGSGGVVVLSQLHDAAIHVLGIAYTYWPRGC